jgi:hypothetical protein
MDFNTPIQMIKIPATNGIQCWNVIPNNVDSSVKYSRNASITYGTADRMNAFIRF